MEKRIIDYVRTMENQKRFEIAQRKDQNKKIRIVDKKHKKWDDKKQVSLHCTNTNVFNFI